MNRYKGCMKKAFKLPLCMSNRLCITATPILPVDNIAKSFNHISLMDTKNEVVKLHVGKNEISPNWE